MHAPIDRIAQALDEAQLLVERRGALPAAVSGITDDSRAVRPGSLFVAVKGNMFALNVTTWGWIHLVVGIIAFAVGVGLFYGASWARGAGMGIAVVQAISQFMFLPYYPGWSIIIIALDVAIIWALANYRSDKFM